MLKGMRNVVVLAAAASAKWLPSLHSTTLLH